MKNFLLAFTVLFTIAATSFELYWQHAQSNKIAVIQSSIPLSTQIADSNGVMANYSSVPDFTLTDRTGISVKLQDLAGKVWLADFIYTTCPDTCPMLSSRIAEIQNSALREPDVRLVSFSVNPDHDSPEVLQKYADRFKAQSGWFFLTGDKAQISKIATTGFLLGFQRASGDSVKSAEITHSTKIALVDRRGKVRRFYDGAGPNAAKSEVILADLKALLKEE